MIEQDKLQDRAVGKGPPFLLDVRNGYEWDTGRFEVRTAGAARAPPCLGDSLTWHARRAGR